MVRIDDPRIHNPFGWRLADLDDPATSETRRCQLRDELLVCEAIEIAHGYRHLTVVHGPGDTIDECRSLDDFYDQINAVVSDGWARVRGTVDYVTITVHGPNADDTLARLSTMAETAGRATWLIVDRPTPPECM